jgi:hypothetical protein
VTSGDDALLFTVRPGSEKYADDDERWIAQQIELFAELRREAGGVRREMAAQAGTKGAVETIVLALASAGSVTAAVQCLQSWLTRDRTRMVEIIYTVAGHEEKIVLRGTRLDDAAAKQFTDVAIARLRNER